MLRQIMKVAALMAAAGMPALAQTDTAPDYDESGGIGAGDLLILQQHLLDGDLSGDLNSDGELDNNDLFAFLSLAKNAGAPSDEPPSDRGAMPNDGELLVSEPDLVAVVCLPSGLVLHFLELAPGVVAVLEEAPDGARGLDSIPELRDASSAAEVYHAVTRDVKTPQALEVECEDASGGPARPRGWARAILEGDDGGGDDDVLTGNCTDSTFRDYINSFGYNDRGTPTFRLNKVPDSTTLFQKYDYIPGNGEAYTFYRYFVGGDAGSRWFDIDRYISRVAVCAIDTYESDNPYGLAHPPISYQGYYNNHMGPVVRMMYRLPGESVWRLAAAKDFAASEVGKQLTWHFYTGLNWDWRTDIYWAGGDDQFDIGHAVEDL